VVQKRLPAVERARFKAQQQRALEVLERRRQQEVRRHREKVEVLQRRPVVDSSACGDTTPPQATLKQKAEEHSKLVLRRHAHLQQIRQSQLLHELQLKAAKGDKPPVDPKSKVQEDAHSQQVQENKRKLQSKRQRDAERGLQCRNLLAQARIDDIKRKQATACAALKEKNAGAVRKALERGERFKLMQMEIVKNELQVK
jgi:hypothetical protein